MLRWGAIGLLVHVGIVGILFASGLSAASFVHFGIGDPATDLARRVVGADVPAQVGGGDGVPFWVLARDPTLRSVRPFLDRPSYRADRIGYSLLASPWRLGGEQGLFWGLIITNLAAAFVGTAAAAAVALRVGARSRSALSFALCPGVTAATWLDVCDGLALALVLVTAFAVLERRWFLAGVAAVGATLTKEVSIVPLTGMILLPPLIGGWRRRLAALAAPVVVFGFWALYVRSRVGWPGEEGTDIVAPLDGYLKVFRHQHPYGTDVPSNVVAGGLLLVAMVAMALWLRRRTVLSSAALPVAFLTFCLGPYVVGRSVNSLRATAPLITLVALDLLGREGRREAAKSGTLVAPALAVRLSH